MAWDSCEIILNSSAAGTFYAGDIVTGNVIVKFQQKQKLEYFNLDVIGICKAQWTRPMPTIPYIKIYSETKRVLDIHSDLITIPQEHIVKPGIYSYPFHFLLPLDLPSTFKSSVAKVYYYIQVQCKAAYKFKKKKSITFNVTKNLNVNHLDEFLVPTLTEIHKVFWHSGKLSLFLQSYKGFAPDQKITFEGSINNDNKIKISKLHIILVQKLEYNVSTGYLNDEKIVEKVSCNKFTNSAKETFHLEMTIPRVTPSSNYPMIKVSYVLKVEMLFTYHFSMYHELPVTISTVPVMHMKL